MPIEFWTGKDHDDEPFEHWHERTAQNSIIRFLQAEFADEHSLVVVVFAFFIESAETDVCFLKRDAIAVIEIKECNPEMPIYGGKNGLWLDANGNAAWKSNPFQQVYKRRFKLIDKLRSEAGSFLASQQKASQIRFEVAGIVGLNPTMPKNSKIDISEKWFRCCGVDQLGVRLREITTPSCRLSDAELREFVERSLGCRRIIINPARLSASRRSVGVTRSAELSDPFLFPGFSRSILDSITEAFDSDVDIPDLQLLLLLFLEAELRGVSMAATEDLDLPYLRPPGIHPQAGDLALGDSSFVDDEYVAESVRADWDEYMECACEAGLLREVSRPFSKPRRYALNALHPFVRDTLIAATLIIETVREKTFKNNGPVPIGRVLPRSAAVTGRTVVGFWPMDIVCLRKIFQVLKNGGVVRELPTDAEAVEWLSQVGRIRESSSGLVELNGSNWSNTLAREPVRLNLSVADLPEPLSAAMVLVDETIQGVTQRERKGPIPARVLLEELPSDFPPVLLSLADAHKLITIKRSVDSGGHRVTFIMKKTPS